MINLLRFLLLFLLVNNSILAQSDCTPIPEVNFPGGRVIMSFDGNVHDDDDIVAMAYSAGLWWAAGLQDKVVQIEYNNHVCSVNTVESDGTGPGTGYDGQNMRTTASGAISNFGYSASIFYDFEKVANASTNKMAAEIENSTASNPLWIIAAGPMETVWRGLEKATRGHDNVTVISHSKWNQDHLHCNGVHNWADLKSKNLSKGTFFVENCSGSCSDATKLNDQNGGFSSAISNWAWMKNSSKEYNRWIFGRNPFGSKFDPSDAGMSYFLITGGPFQGGDKTPDHNDARKLMENPCHEQKLPPTGKTLSFEITSPSDGQTFEIDQNVPIELGKSDDDGFVKHQIFINNTLVDTDGTTYTPYVLKILGNETYVIRAEVTDNSGVKSVETVTVSGKEDEAVDEPVQEDSEPTTFDIVSPIDGEVYNLGATITVDLNSSGNSFVLHKVYVNGQLVDTDGANFTPHKITNAQAGNYTIETEVTDTSGQVSSKTVVVAVGNTDAEEEQEPQEESGSSVFDFSSPTNGQNFSIGSNIQVNLVPKEKDIIKYEVFVNDKLVDTDGANFTPHIIKNAPAGTLKIRAKVTKSNGSSTVKSIDVNVDGSNSSDSDDTEQNSNPISLSVSPMNGQAFETGEKVKIDVSASSDSGVIVEHLIFVNNRLVDTDGGTYTPYIINNISNGEYQIKVDVKDDRGNTESQEVQIVVKSKGSVSLTTRLPSMTIDSGGSTTYGSDSSVAPAFRIAQNPVQSSNLQVYTNKSMTLAIFNLNGVVLKEINDTKTEVNVNVSGWAPGVYIVKSENSSAKFIIPED